MTEEMMNNEVVEMESNVMNVDDYEGEIIEESEVSKGSKIVKGSLIGLAGVAGLALAAKGAKLAKEKYDTWTVDRLRKKGFVVVEPQVLSDDIIDGEVKTEEDQTEVVEEKQTNE